jgi:hypothetical protein
MHWCSLVRMLVQLLFLRLCLSMNRRRPCGVTICGWTLSDVILCDQKWAQCFVLVNTHCLWSQRIGNWCSLLNLSLSCRTMLWCELWHLWNISATFSLIWKWLVFWDAALAFGSYWLKFQRRWLLLGGSSSSRGGGGNGNGSCRRKRKVFICFSVFKLHLTYETRGITFMLCSL